MAYNHYGPRAENLIQLINNSICSTLFLHMSYNKWSDNQLKPFNVIQTKALRIALGLPQWTPNIVLMKLAEQEILRQNQKTVQFSSVQYSEITVIVENLANALCSDKILMAAVAEWYRYRIVACLVTSSSPVPLKTRRVGQRCTLNLSRAEMSSRWCGVVVRRGRCQLRCRPRHLTMVQNYVVRRQKPSCC
ncbi:uncharacterized protein TNCV_2984861 [Trichonephila clavipes]|nr:uncharacterized protein TNCV_2984861 [Trichonephila clavipes]